LVLYRYNGQVHALEILDYSDTEETSRPSKKSKTTSLGKVIQFILNILDDNYNFYFIKNRSRFR